MSSKYTATFTWPPTPSHNVFITGTFDSWSGNTHRLHKNSDTGFWEGKVDLAYGQKVSYKYVVDGQWLIREDEAKEWDAIGNMNNVYTAPHAPEPTATPASPKPAAAAAVTPSSPKAATATPAALTSPKVDTQPTTSTSTESKDLVAAQAPGSGVGSGETFEAGKVAQGESTEAGAYDLGGIMLGAPIGAAAAAAASTLIPSSHPAPIPSTKTTAAPSDVAAAIPGPEVVPSTAKSTSTASPATGSHAPSEPIKALADETAPTSAPATATNLVKTTTDPHVDAKAVHEPADPLKAIAETPAAVGAGGAGGFFATVAAAAAEIVHDVTGIDVAGTDPVSVEDAKKNGIDPVTGKPIASATTTSKAVPEPADKITPTVNATGPAPASFAKPEPAILPSKETSAPATGPSAAAVGSSLDSKPAPASATVAVPPVVAAAPAAIPVVPAPAAFPHTEGAPAVPAKTETGPSTSEKVASTTKHATSNRPSEPKEVDVFSSNTGEKEPKGNDVPSQTETKDVNHKKVPQPVITNVGGPTKDRTQPSKADAANQEVTGQPGTDLHAVKAKADEEKANGGMDGLPSRSYAKKVEPTQAEPVAGLPLATTQQPLAKDVAPATPAKTGVNGSTGPAAVAAGTPATPASRVVDRESKVGGAFPSPSSSANSTPQKPAKDTSNDPMRKRKSSFFAKIKGAFHKDKSPKA